MKYIKNFFIFLFCILLSSYLILQIPTVKRFTIEKSIEFVNTNADFHISYDDFVYKDLKDISFANVVIEGNKDKKELLKAQKLQTGLNIFKLFFKRELNLKNLDFTDLVVFADENIFSNSSSQIDLNYFNAFSINIENINLVNCSLFFDNNATVKDTKVFFDHNHFNVSKINSHIENMILSKRGVSACVKNFTAESGKIIFKDLSFEAECYDKISLKDITLDTNFGKLSGNCEIFNLKNFDYILDLKNLTLSQNVPHLDKLNSEISLQCLAKGNLHESYIQDFRFCYKKNIASFSGIIDFDKYAYDLKNIYGQFHLKSLSEIIPAKVLQIIPCKSGKFDGSLKGGLKKGNVTLNIHSKVGELKSNLDFDNIFSQDLKINGKVKLKNVNIKDFNITNLNSDHVIVFSQEEKRIDNKILGLDYNNVRINNIEFNLKENGESYFGICNVNDKNLKTSLNFKIYNNSVVCSGNCDLQNLNKLYGGEKRIDIKNDVYINGRKDNILVNFNNNFLRIGDTDLNLQLLQTNFYTEDNLSQFNISSDILDLKICDIPKQGKELKKIFLQFCNNLYNWTENKPMTISKDSNFKIPFYINLKDSKIFHLVNQSLVLDCINIYGDFVHINGKKFFNVNIDKIEDIHVQNGSLKNTNLRITLGLNERKKLPIINIVCEIDKAHFNGFFANNILYKIDSHDRDINTHCSLDSNVFKFNWDVKSFFDNGQIIFDLTNEDILCSLNDWQMEKKGCIKLTSKNISIDNMTFEKNNMFLICNYYLTHQDSVWNDNFFFQIKNVNIENWNNDSERNIKGLLNGEIKKNYSSFLDINFSLDDLIINKDNFGSMKLTTKYDTEEHIYNYTLLSKKEDTTNLDINGVFYESSKKINVQCFFNDFDLKIIESFCDPVCSKLEGLWTGHMNVLGNISRPRFWGDIDMRNGSVLFIPINCEFKTSGHFKGDIDGLNITNLQLRDKKGGVADFNGKIKINFQNFPELYLKGLANKSQILHTTEQDNSVFYGDLFCSGDVIFAGPVNFLTISGDVKNMKESKIFLNFRKNNDINYGFIHFKDKDDKTADTYEHKENNLVNGIRLNLDTTLDDSLLTSIKIPLSEINIQGNGKIHILTTFNHDFNLKGKANITKGDYLLSLGNLVNKKFKIEKDSSFNFLGDINLATLDITATEDVILNNSNDNLVILKVITSGLIQDPTVKYDIDLSRSKNIDSNIKSKIATSEDMRNYYFLNLLLFRCFDTNSANISADIFNFFNKTIQMSNEKSKFWIDLDSTKFLSKKLFKVDLGFVYDNLEISKEISNGKSDFADMILDNVEIRYIINKDFNLYTNIKRDKVKFGFKRFN